MGVQSHDAFISTLGYEGPQWVPVELTCLSIHPSVFIFLCPSARPYVHPYVRLSVSLSGCPRRFLEIIPAARNCPQHMRPSVFSVVRGPFTIFLFVLIYSVWVQRWDAFIPTMGSEGPQWGLVEIIYPSICQSINPYVRPSVHPSIHPSARMSVHMSLCLSVYLAGRLCHFLAIINAACNCTQRMRP